MERRGWRPTAYYAIMVILAIMQATGRALCPETPATTP